MQWSYDSKFLASKCELMPNAVYIWDMHKVELHSLIHQAEPVKSMKFAPQINHLVICTGQSRISVWTPISAAIYDVSQDGFLKGTLNEIKVNKVKWHPKGDKLILIGASSAIIAFPGPEFYKASHIGQSLIPDYEKQGAYYEEGESILSHTAAKLVSSNSNYLGGSGDYS